jgi:hypothetical protein
MLLYLHEPLMVVPSHTLLLNLSRLLKLLLLFVFKFPSSPRNLSLYQEVFSQDGTLTQLSEVWGMKGCLVICWPIVLGKSLSRQTTALGLRFLGVKVFVSQLGLPVCHEGHLAYLVVEGLALPPHRRVGAGPANYFLLYTISVLFHCTFQLSCLSFLVSAPFLPKLIMFFYLLHLSSPFFFWLLLIEHIL